MPESRKDENYIISKHEFANISVRNKCVVVSHWLKNICLYFLGILDFFRGFKSLCFAVEPGFMEARNTLI